MRRRFLRALSALFALSAAGSLALAHDIPADVTVRMFLRPADQHLELLMRVPLASMRDVDFPLTADGYLDTRALAPQLPAVARTWLGNFIGVYEDGERLPSPRIAATRISLPSNGSFASFPAALALITGPSLPASDAVSWNQVFFDVLLEYPIRSARSSFSIDPRLRHLAARVITVVRFLPEAGVERDFELEGNPGLVPLDPSWRQAAARFVRLGFFHILDGTDHLLFVFCLVIPLCRLRPLLAVITAFTAAHSITLMASAFGLAPDALWFPPLIEMLIAASIVWMALENIVSVNVRHRWIIAFGFGLVHGFGFSFALRQMLQFAGSHLLLSLVSFNLGVELGQMAVLAVLIPLLTLLFRFVVAQRMGTIILSAFIAHTGWHWLLERAAQLRNYRFGWPEVSWAMVSLAIKYITALWIAGGIAWIAWRFIAARFAARSRTAAALEPLNR